MRLLPYLYSAFAAYHFEGVPPLRPMLLEDPALDQVEDQFMFGPSMLVAPFYDKTGWARDVRLPEGRWYDFRTGAYAGSGGRVKAVSRQGEIPLYVREGSLIPMLKEPVTNTDQAYGRPLEVRFYGRTGGTFDLYEDDGKTFDYEKGRYRIRRLTVSKDANGVFGLTETIIKDGGPPMFGQAELRVMSER
jgi:alpha-glucosidase (family GH31 glycosyl hydrolase)